MATCGQWLLHWTVQPQSFCQSGTLRVPSQGAEARSLGLAWLASGCFAPEHKRVQVAERRRWPPPMGSGSALQVSFASLQTPGIKSSDMCRLQDSEGFHNTRKSSQASRDLRNQGISGLKGSLPDVFLQVLRAQPLPHTYLASCSDIKLTCRASVKRCQSNLWKN